MMCELYPPISSNWNKPTINIQAGIKVFRGKNRDKQREREREQERERDKEG